MNAATTNKTATGGKRRLAALGLAALLLALFPAAAGCQGREGEGGAPVDRPRGDAFRPDDSPSSVHRFAQAQSASGARNDATLHPHHFDRGALNSLGQEKLALMLKDDELSDPVVVYLEVPSDNLLQARQDSARVFLQDRGLQDGQVRLEVGPNPSARGPAAPGVAAKRLIDSGAPIGTNPEPTGSAGAKPR